MVKFLILILWLATACAPVLPPEQVNENADVEALKASISSHRTSCFSGITDNIEIIDPGPVIETPKIKPGQKIFLLGDSLAVGLSRPISAIAASHNIAFKSMAKEGTRIDQWSNKAELYQNVKAFKPDLILISLGTNDEYMKLDAQERQRPHIKKLLMQLRAQAPVVWIGPPTFPTTGGYAWKGTNGAIPLIKNNVPTSNYFPSHKLNIPRAPDQLHPSIQGAKDWAEKIWEFII